MKNNPVPSSKMDTIEASTSTNIWPVRKKNEKPKANKIKEAKVKGEEHLNHKGKLVSAKQIGGNCRYLIIKKYIVCAF